MLEPACATCEEMAGSVLHDLVMNDYEWGMRVNGIEFEWLGELEDKKSADEVLYFMTYDCITN